MTDAFTGDRIILEGLGFYGYHGVFPEERKLGQRFVVDLTCGLDLSPAGDTDELGRTASYADIYDVTKAAFEEGPFNLIEAVAQRIADRVFAAFADIGWIIVRVKKPEAPIAMVRGAASVELHRTRKD
ncbi:dihydroneopterin aldolase [Devosia geojensis]|uniref:dihydroneopterin aldolase n=1 Tax=Devosia geojensis TaxID=443610 RepID=UPI000B324853|nr:dihydroneopterin aldolase [Devosia geojensis]